MAVIVRKKERPLHPFEGDPYEEFILDAAAAILDERSDVTKVSAARSYLKGHLQVLKLVRGQVGMEKTRWLEYILGVGKGSN